MVHLSKNKKLTVALYSHIEAYPPSINAVQALSKQFEKITIVCMNVLHNEFPFHENIEVITLGDFIPIREFEAKPIVQKIKTFIQFVFLLKKHLSNANTFIAYDGIPLFAYRMARFISPFAKKPKLWYHNHDVYEPGVNRKYSIAWFAEKNEPTMFSKLDIFSLPSNDRKDFFPMNKLKGEYFFLPNFPSKELYSQFQNNNKKVDKPFSILYQGSIGKGHGLELIIELLNELNQKYSCNLVLKGFISDDYKSELIQLASQHEVKHLLIFKGVTPYKEVPLLTSSCHIGIAIHASTDRMNRTLGTASNKIYEYAACGLPVLYFNSEQYIKHLNKFAWAYPVDLNKQSILFAINQIIKNYSDLSRNAIQDFNNNLNFEFNFNDISKLFK